MFANNLSCGSEAYKKKLRIMVKSRKLGKHIDQAESVVLGKIYNIILNFAKNYENKGNYTID